MKTPEQIIKRIESLQRDAARQETLALKGWHYDKGQMAKAAADQWEILYQLKLWILKDGN